jgi:hypothetical protein
MGGTHAWIGVQRGGGGNGGGTEQEGWWMMHGLCIFGPEEAVCVREGGVSVSRRSHWRTRASRSSTSRGLPTPRTSRSTALRSPYHRSRRIRPRSGHGRRWRRTRLTARWCSERIFSTGTPRLWSRRHPRLPRRPPHGDFLRRRLPGLRAGAGGLVEPERADRSRFLLPATRTRRPGEDLSRPRPTTSGRRPGRS